VDEDRDGSGWYSGHQPVARRARLRGRPRRV